MTITEEELKRLRHFIDSLKRTYPTGFYLLAFSDVLKRELTLGDLEDIMGKL